MGERPGRCRGGTVWPDHSLAMALALHISFPGPWASELDKAPVNGGAAKEALKHFPTMWRGPIQPSPGGTHLHLADRQEPW